MYPPGVSQGVSRGVGWELVWVDRQGREEPLPLPGDSYFFPRVSPDGRRVAVAIAENGRLRDLHVFDVATGAGLRLTRGDPAQARTALPVWTPDGRTIVFASTEGSVRPPYGNPWWGSLWSVPADGSGPPSRLTAEGNQVATGMSHDGRAVLFMEYASSERSDIRLLTLQGDGVPETVVSSPFFDAIGELSPDGRWLAYQSDESGTHEVCLRPFPGPGAKVPVSIGGGSEPLWSSDGGELFYRAPDGRLTAASIEGDDEPRVTARTPLFLLERYQGWNLRARNFHLAPDGRFLMIRGTAHEGSGGWGSREVVILMNAFQRLGGRGAGLAR